MSSVDVLVQSFLHRCPCHEQRTSWMTMNVMDNGECGEASSWTTMIVMDNDEASSEQAHQQSSERRELPRWFAQINRALNVASYQDDSCTSTELWTSRVTKTKIRRRQGSRQIQGEDDAKTTTQTRHGEDKRKTKSRQRQSMTKTKTKTKKTKERQNHENKTNTSQRQETIANVSWSIWKIDRERGQHQRISLFESTNMYRAWCRLVQYHW